MKHFLPLSVNYAANKNSHNFELPRMSGSYNYNEKSMNLYFTFHGLIFTNLKNQLKLRYVKKIKVVHSL